MHMSDILIIGAGPVGATFALLAHARGLRGLGVSLVDARPGPSTEERSLALSHGSRLLLERAGAWPQDMQVTPIHAIHTSQKGGFGKVMLTREDANVPALGYVVGYAALQDALDRALERAAIPVIYGARITAIDADRGELGYSVNDQQHTVQARLLVMADGGANLDKVPRVAVDVKDYGQSAMLAQVVADRPHGNVAYERFTTDGPAALLPSADGTAHYSMVWVAPHAQIDALMALEEDAARDRFQTHFGKRAGGFLALTNRRRYPLKLRQTTTRVVGKMAIIGNAAQAMHPVAGQGFNLGLRDAATLAATLATTLASTLAEAPGAELALRAYAGMREVDIARGVGFTDLLASTFISDTSTLRVPRGMALAAVDMLPFARRALASRMLFGARS